MTHNAHKKHEEFNCPDCGKKLHLHHETHHPHGKPVADNESIHPKYLCASYKCGAKFKLGSNGLQKVQEWNDIVL